MAKKATIDDILGSLCILYGLTPECKECNGRDYKCQDYLTKQNLRLIDYEDKGLEIIRGYNDSGVVAG